MSVVTVLGKLHAKDLGRTLTHEHLSLDYTGNYVNPPVELKEYLDGNLSLENIGFVQRYPYSSHVNLLFNDEEAVKYDVELYKRHGGGTIVENTTHGIRRNAKFLKELSLKTGVHIIAGSGFYVADSQSATSLKYSVEDIYKRMENDLFSGCEEDLTVRCGFLGEIATNYPAPSIGDGFELRSIEATGKLQEATRCPVSFHPGRHRDSPREIMRKYTEAGGDDKKAVMSHLDRTLTTDEDLLEFADEFRCYLQQDLFGTEVLVYQFSPLTQMPSDAQRIARVQLLINNGFKDRALLSHDIHTRQRLVKYGGHGYMHIFSNIIPKMKLLGITDDLIDNITISNPSQWLTW